MPAAMLASCTTSSFAGAAVRSRATPRAQAVSRSVVAAATPDRQLWLPGIKPPAHLDGSLPADYGFDPLNLGAEPNNLKWFFHAELIHARTAMTAVAGILIPGILSKVGILKLPEWYDAGKVVIQNSFAPFSTLLAVQFILYHFVEIKRLQDYKKPGSQAEPGSFFGLEGAFKGTGENGYPGGVFDPLKLSQSKDYETFKVRELKNGRLAMLAALGFAAQYAATGKGPIDNLVDHIANPALINFTTNGVSLPLQVHPLLQ